MSRHDSTPRSPRPNGHQPAPLATASPRLAWRRCLAGGLASALGLSGGAAFADDLGSLPWPEHGLNPHATRYAAAAQIHTGNVAQLTQAWTYRSGVKASFQSTPIVLGHRMLVSLPYSHVVALDARNGQVLWRYEHVPRHRALCCGPANRGVAVSGGQVFVGTVDARLVALDLDTGRVNWDVAVAPSGDTPDTPMSGGDAVSTMRQSMAPHDTVSQQPVVGMQGVGIAMAPLVADGRVIVGINGVGYGLHTSSAVVGSTAAQARPGLLAAFDPKTGHRLWQFDVTGPGWEGPMHPSTPDRLPLRRSLSQERATLGAHRQSWRQGGGSIYATPAYDAERGLVFVGTGNPAPAMEGSARPGDNLYTSSLVALDVRTGRRVWHYQQVPHDRWGLDVASPPVLFDWQPAGARPVPAVAQPSKLGWVYVHDRRDGRLLYRSERFVPQANLLALPTPQGVWVKPGITGGANWSPSAYDPTQGRLFVPGIDMPTRYRQATGPDGRPYVVTEPGTERAGTLTALDLQHQGQVRWQRRFDEPLVGGVLATAGHLLFTGLGQQVFAALDSRDGRTLWQVRCNAGVNAPPITYQIDGQQYVAVAVGGNALFGFPTGDELRVFRLPTTPPSSGQEEAR